MGKNWSQHLRLLQQEIIAKYDDRISVAYGRMLFRSK